MADPIGSFSGLASGIQWRDMVDQIMKLEEARRLSPVQTQLSRANNRRSAWNSYSNLVATLQSSAAKLLDRSAFNTLTTTSGKSKAGETLFTATASGDAQPGSYRIEVLNVARVEKLNGSAQTSTTAALGNTGEFIVNGRLVELTATDTLATIRDKINAVNAGTDPSGVSATILSTSATSHRLILTAENTGSRGIELVDGATGVLQGLGILSATQTANTSPTDSGVAQSGRFQSKNTAIATLLGVTSPPASTTIVIDGQKIEVDLLTDTMISIMNKVTAAGGEASIIEEKVGGDTQYRLAIEGAVTADATATDPAASQRIVELTGFVVNAKAAQITTGQDAKLRIDGFTLTRRTNTITDAVSGMTIDVLAANADERAASVVGAGLAMVTDPDTIEAGTHEIALSILTTITQNVSDDSADLVVSNDPGGLADGVYSVNLSTTTTRTTGTSSGDLTGVVAPGTTSAGTYAVNVTQVATQSSATGNLAGNYTGFTGDTMSVTVDGVTRAYNLTSLQSLDSVVAGLNNMFTTNGMSMTASNSGGRLKLTHNDYGSAEAFTVTTSHNRVDTFYGVGSTAGTAYQNGLNVAGTIGGIAATGSGRTLTGGSGAVNGLQVTYSGASTGAVGTVTVTDTTEITGGTIGGEAATWDAGTSSLTVNGGGSLAGLAVTYSGPVTSGAVANVTFATTVDNDITGVTIGGEAAVWDSATSTIRGAMGSTFEGLALTYTGPAVAGRVGDLVVEGDIGADLAVTRNLDAAVAAVQSFASAYNAVVAFGNVQRSQGAALAANGTLRSMLGSLKSVLLTDVPGLTSASTPYTRGGLVGVAVNKTGQLEVDATLLKDAISTRLNDVINLFATGGLATDGQVTYKASTTDSTPGTYAVSITTAAAQASHTGTALGGGFAYTAGDGISDTLSITDSYSGATAAYVVRHGEDLDTIVSELNTAFGNAGMALTAENSATGLKITSSQYGSARTFTVAGAAAAGLGLTAATYAGTDVAGTIGGNAATGVGQVLTGSAGASTAGLAITYIGAAPNAAAGTIRFSRGLAGEVQRISDSQSRANDGSVAVQTTNLDRSIELLDERISNLQARLEIRREALIKQFTRMEEAMSKFQSQSSWLNSQLGSLMSNSGQ